jgi:hypothetical protein
VPLLPPPWLTLLPQTPPPSGVHCPARATAPQPVVDYGGHSPPPFAVVVERPEPARPDAPRQPTPRGWLTPAPTTARASARAPTKKHFAADRRRSDCPTPRDLDGPGRAPGPFPFRSALHLPAAVTHARVSAGPPWACQLRLWQLRRRPNASPGNRPCTRRPLIAHTQGCHILPPLPRMCSSRCYVTKECKGIAMGGSVTRQWPQLGSPQSQALSTSGCCPPRGRRPDHRPPPGRTG